jgi:hypothetical protein
MADVQTQTMARQQQRRGKHTPTPQPPLTPRELLQQHPQYPSLKDPSIVPLAVQDGSILIRTATSSSGSSSAGTALLQNLNSNLPFNVEASVDGCLVFGARNTAGPSSVTNITLGSVSGVTPGIVAEKRGANQHAGTAVRYITAELRRAVCRSTHHTQPQQQQQQQQRS